ncbi:hypothetical protein H6F93_04715 [Leptolyngbya sp. FACHB-671]|uniref:hypothetical protein n=1 Tax=Leptolyngbya sp. FACHB-671 TaxID=2692812 RepID=UPI001682C5BF|nr:hypothetical protein [Leptolyngbya sp. FACHB-671]MBD2066836.1 hypothetical protein [Leptolyngbya sp. FACHB-671]
MKLLIARKAIYINNLLPLKIIPTESSFLEEEVSVSLKALFLPNTYLQSVPLPFLLPPRSRLRLTVNWFRAITGETRAILKQGRSPDVLNNANGD